MSLFKVENVKFSSTTQDIIKGVSLCIEKGSIVGFLGKSGSGKSTLLKLISGILSPTEGRVLFDGQDVRLMSKNENKKFRKRCSYVFQDSALWENQTVEQNLNLPLQTQYQDMGIEERQRKIREICKTVGYTRSLSLRPVNLSMGEQKLIAFARALINEPEVLFLDECTESLDVSSVEQVLKIIKNFIDNGNTVVYVSHRTDFINSMMNFGNSSDRSVIYDLDDGYLRGADNYEI